MKLTKLGLNELKLKATDDCGNETRGTRMINIIQRLIAGQYINIVESGDSATISADISEDYYDKAKIQELLADLDTVKFKIVSVLPSVGVSNFIYLVEKTAPDVGYDQYIWEADQNQFYPIGDTDIDLSDYYTKLQTYSKEEVYNMSEVDARLENKQDLFSNGLDITPDDNKYLSFVDLGSKIVQKLRLSSLWGDYIKPKFTSTIYGNLSDTTKISSIDPATTPFANHFTIAQLWTYLKNNKFGRESVTTVTDGTKMGTLDVGQTNPVKEFTAATLWTYILTKLTTTISSASTNQQAPSNKAVYDYVEARRRYLHILTRYNNDALQFPMGWCAIITENDSETYESIAQWLYNNQYRSLETAYYFAGGCCGTTGVRNSADTGTTYIGRVVSGAFSEDGTTIKYKYDYNAWVSINGERCVVYSHPLMKLTP